MVLDLTACMDTRVRTGRRYGVNGGAGVMGLGLQQRLRGWLVDAMSSGKAVRSQPYGS